MRGGIWRSVFPKSAFLSIYGSPLLQAAVGIDPKDGGRRRVGKDPLHDHLVQERIAELKSRIPDGGLREATVRALLYIGTTRGAVDERAFEAIRRIRQSKDLAPLPIDGFKALVREQFFMLLIDSSAAIAAMPAMLASEPHSRTQAFELIKQVIGAERRAATSGRRAPAADREPILWRERIDTRSQQRPESQSPGKTGSSQRGPQRRHQEMSIADRNLDSMAPLSPAGPPPGSKYERVIARAKSVVPPAVTIVAHPCDETSLRGAIEAAQEGIIKPVLVGPAAKIRAVAKQYSIPIDGVEIVDAPHSDAAAAKAVELIREAKGELLMKGSLHTDELMRAVTSGTTGLRTARRISHVFVMDVPTYSETLFITDAAINIAPDLDVKRDIVQNAIDLWVQCGLGRPKVAILSAVETVTSKIPSTIDAAALCKMADRGQITGGDLDGPLAFDNAVDPKAAEIKGIKSAVAGHAQILVVPDLESGNMLAKNLSILARADGAGIVLGARVPIILTSRADSVRARLASCAVAVLYADARRRIAAVPAH